jgi:hypothetical protein
MRRGSFSIQSAQGAEADVSIFVFPGAAGGLLENVNRWRGQIGLPPFEESHLAAETTQIKSESGLTLVTVDMTGPSGERILGAVLEHGSESWFFKIKGPDALVLSEKPAFLAFIKSVHQP